MYKIFRFILVISVTGLSYSAFGSNRDTLINDTLVLSQEKIIKVTLHCNVSDENLRINSQSEFDKIFGSDCQISPNIDFSKETLLYFSTTASGCKMPDCVTTVKIANGTVFYRILIIQHGGCLPLLLIHNCIAIPNIYGNYKVDYKYDVVTQNDMK